MERADAAVIVFSNLYVRSVPILISKAVMIVQILTYSVTINPVMFFVMMQIKACEKLTLYQKKQRTVIESFKMK